MEGEPALPVTVHVDSAVDVVIIEGVLDRVGTNKYEPALKSTFVVSSSEHAEAGADYVAKYGSAPGAESLDLDPSLLNFLVRPRIVYGWRSEDVKTATRWTFAKPR
jgi:hypothetical protein